MNEQIQEAIEKAKIPKGTLLILAKIIGEDETELDMQSGEFKKYQFSKSELLSLLSLVTTDAFIKGWQSYNTEKGQNTATNDLAEGYWKAFMEWQRKEEG